MSNRTKKARAAALQKASEGLSKSNKHITKISATSTPRPSQPASEASKTASSAAEKATESAKRPDTQVAPKTAPEASPAPLDGKSVNSTTAKTASNGQNPSQTPTKSDPKSAKKSRKSQKSSTTKPFILFRPFLALGHYLRDSWREIRQVRWPNRKATWKMTLAVIFYCAIFMGFVLLLDTLFTFLINLLIK